MKEDKNTALSVIIPVYNVEPYLCECIDSVLKNDAEMQIILVDDGSSDRSGKICEDYAAKHDRIEVIHKENGGLSSARNAGLELAVGDYVCFVDSDDVVSSEMFSYLLHTAQEKNADIVTCGILFFYHNNTAHHAVCVHSEEGTYRAEEAIQFLLRSDGFGDYAVNKMYKRALFDGIRYPEGKLYEDVYTTYKVFDKAETVAVTNRDFYYYRYNSEGISHSQKFKKHTTDFVYASLEQLDFVREKYPAFVGYAVNKALTACVVIYKHYIAHYRDFCFDPVCKQIQNTIGTLLENEDCSQCREEILKEARLINKKPLLWQYNYHIKLFADKAHNHPGLQHLIEKFSIKTEIG